jgi:MFS family permease
MGARIQVREDERGLFGLPRPVWLLGLGSLFTDAASEAIYPLLPLFLTRVLGAGAISLGIIEGTAEAANSLLKIISGRLSDRWNRRRPIVIAGYSLSSAIRPLIALVTSWQHVLVVRFVDRVGKGIRGAPRDALLAAAATPATRGRVFGFHRAMDHAGAVLGPVLASLFLLAYPGHYRTLFLLTVVPGAVAVWMFFLVKEVRTVASTTQPTPQMADTAWRRLPKRFYFFLMVLLLFALGNSSDAFLLLRLTDLGVSPALIPLLWAAHHVVKAGVSVVAGAGSDRRGRRRVIGAGWVVYALVYAGFAFATSESSLIVLFLAYGLYYGFAEGTEKALVADLAPADLRGTAFGLYYGVLGVGALLASVLFGLIWTAAGTAAAFGIGASLAVTATLLLFTVVRDERVA